jgi:hypothetical protein
MESSDFLPPLPPRSFASLGGTSRARFFAPAAVERHGPEGLDTLTGCPVRLVAGGDRTSQVPGRPRCTHALFSDSGEASAPGWVNPPRRSGAAFRLGNGVGPREMCNFGAPWHGLRAPCVRFAAGVAPALRNTRFRLVASLYRTGRSARWV